MKKVCFYKQDEIKDEKLKFAVIATRYQNKWVFCRHKMRATWEIPGGHREFGESVQETAHRELVEETGALDAKISPVAVYGVESDGKQTYGMLFFAEINSFGVLSDDSEIGEIRFFDALPKELTYPDIQPYLYYLAEHWFNLKINEFKKVE